MSLKASAFSIAMPMPKTVDKFYIALPGNAQSLFRVSAASLPYANYAEGAIWLFGRQVVIPSALQCDGEWSCVYEEDVALTGAMTISSLERRLGRESFINQRLNIFVTDQLTGMVPQLAVTLKYVWLKKVEPLQLDWSKPTERAKWGLTFRYSDIKRWY